jgi:hypothetical protein
MDGQGWGWTNGSIRMCPCASPTTHIGMTSLPQQPPLGGPMAATPNKLRSLQNTNFPRAFVNRSANCSDVEQYLRVMSPRSSHSLILKKEMSM